jgi:ATP-dependent RNA helicase DDX46/PRP5
VLKEIVKRVEEATGAAVTCRGMFVPPGRAPPAGERRLHLLIEGTNDMAVKRARMELRRSLEEETVRLGGAASTSHYAQYSI